MSSITKVALAGATGNLGPAILNQLLNAGFKVTVLTRKNNTHSFPSFVTVIPVDYDSLDSLTNALRGQEALVSTLASVAIATQLPLVEAAAKAHVKRFIPSEFGSNLLNEKRRVLPVFRDKIAVQDALKKEAASGGITYTLISSGPLLDWGIMVGFIMNLKEKSIDLLDGGGRVPPNYRKGRRRRPYAPRANKGPRGLAAMGKKATGADGWKENVVPIDEVLEQAWAERKKDKPDPDTVLVSFVKASFWGEGYGGHFEKLDNELLGIKEMSDAQVQGLVNSLAK